MAIGLKPLLSDYTLTVETALVSGGQRVYGQVNLMLFNAMQGDSLVRRCSTLQGTTSVNVLVP